MVKIGPLWFSVQTCECCCLMLLPLWVGCWVASSWCSPHMFQGASKPVGGNLLLLLRT
jgi:hypothetical protein